MLEINPALPANLTELLTPSSDATKPTAEASTATATETGQPSPTDFDQLLQELVQQQNSTPESALPELLAVVASLVSPLAKPEPPLKDQPKEKKSESAPAQTGTESDALAMLQALLGSPPIAQPVSKDEPPKTTASVVAKPAELPDVQLEAPKGDGPPKQTLNLKDFDVRRFEFKTELEIATVQPKLIRVAALPGILPSQWRPNLVQPRTAKAFSNFSESVVATAPALDQKPETPLITAPEAVERVRVVMDPPPPPPVARTVSIDIGDPESQVRVVLRERGGQLSVQFGAATERLREDLQTASPQLMHELRRENAHSTVTLDFSNFGSATDAGRETPQDSRRKKSLKSEAVFAEVDETAYLDENPPFSKSF